MNCKEKKVLDLVNDRVNFMLDNNYDKNYIAECLDDIIYSLPDESSSELFSILYRIQDKLLLADVIK